LFVDVQSVTAVVAFLFVPRYGSSAGSATPFFVLFFQPLLCIANLEAIQSLFGVLASVGTELSQAFVFCACAFETTAFVAGCVSFLFKARLYGAFLAVVPQILLWSRAASAFYFFFRYSLLVCGDVQEFASVLECAVDVAGAAVDATFAEEVAGFCGIQFSSGDQGEGSLLSLSEGALAKVLGGVSMNERLKKHLANTLI
jgi:hypothetical protein